MATPKQCISSLARLSLTSTARPTATSIPRFLAPSITQVQAQQTRYAGGGTAQMQARAREKEKLKKKRKQQRFKEYKFAVPSKAEQFSLCDAMRYLRAAEVGRPPTSVTYEVSLKIRTIKNGPVVRNRVRLPYPVKNDTRIGVICPENTNLVHDARQAGAVAFGEASLFKLIKENPNNLPFNRLICHQDSVPALNKAGLGRILGPKGLMPSLKTNTITKSIKGMMTEMVGAETYREKIGAIRMPIGNIQFNPKQLSDNIKTLVMQVKGDIEAMEDRVNKDLIEVVLTSTNGPGFSLNGGFLPTDEMIEPDHLSTAM
ncbi:50S ribosomal protein L1 [Pseudomassariella vexata]|uniref:50S ribosomal protein L1 n=1 Tax=Pseudomassariella vexata TaxID=1141098 RepID=A0A1Y2EKT6_9PEZI|nr:50S ribosomal protein L1 [Pseudomassariella vexata]ORY72163.1 50S ribosomal protein L1 [Pseudomassariella vexata]